MNKIKLMIHKNTPFRNCHIGNWIKYNFADIVYTQGIDSRLIWINGVNNILLWEADEKYTSTGICIDDIKCNEFEDIGVYDLFGVYHENKICVFYHHNNGLIFIV